MTKRVVKSRTGEVLIKGDIVYVNDTLMVKNKYDAILPPSLTDDTSSGFNVGSIWVDIVSNTFYVCVDPTLGSAQWSSGGGGSSGKLISGGAGGGGSASAGTAVSCVNGTPNSGGGGGGGSGTETGSSLAKPYAGALGGSGVVIIRYPGPQRGTGGTYSYVGGYSIHTFTGSGSYIA